MDRDTFKQVILRIERQHKLDMERAKKLSDIYGADIDPVDNSILIDAIDILLRKTYSDKVAYLVSEFCWTFNFGKAKGSKIMTIDELWDDLHPKRIFDIEVIDPEDICGGVDAEKNHK